MSQELVDAATAEGPSDDIPMRQWSTAETDRPSLSDGEQTGISPIFDSYSIPSIMLLSPHPDQNLPPPKYCNVYKSCQLSTRVSFLGASWNMAELCCRPALVPTVPVDPRGSVEEMFVFSWRLLSPVARSLPRALTYPPFLKFSP